MKNFTLKTLSEATHIAPSYLSEIGREARRCNTDNLEKICAAIDVPPYVVMKKHYFEKDKEPKDRLPLSHYIQENDEMMKKFAEMKENMAVHKIFKELVEKGSGPKGP